MLLLSNFMGERLRRSPHAFRTVGRYRVYEELASGGMASVHLGCLLGPAGFSKLVAIKCLHEVFAVENEFVAMFLDEARLASSIHHPNVVASLDVVAEQGELLVVMEYVHGETLAALLRSSRQSGETPPISVITRIMCDALEGLHAAHVASLAGRSLNIVHRDVSPQNLMVGADGNTRVLDFGIAQAAVRSQVTAAGTIKGKIAYMSPEQVRGFAVDARTDVFSAGVVLWLALTGRRLFEASNAHDAVNLLLTSPVLPPSAFASGLSTELDRVVLKALARSVGERFQSAHEFAEALRRAAPEGSRREVANWVVRVAKDGLARRLELLEAIEASAIETQATADMPIVAVGSSPRTLPSSSVEITHTRKTSTTSLLSVPRPRKQSRHVVAWVAAIASTVAFSTWAKFNGPFGRTAVPMTASATRSLQAPLAPPPDAAASLPVAPTAVAIESLPLASADATEVPPLPPHAVPAKFSTNKSRSMITPPPHHPQVTSCRPPYRIDDSGIRRVKPECL